MRRAYITNCRDLTMTLSFDRFVPIEVRFTLNPEFACSWPSREDAEIACRKYDSYKISVPSAEVGNYLCKHFQIEQRSNREFAVFCEGPFRLSAFSVGA
jgi:hypothetical protein